MRAALIILLLPPAASAQTYAENLPIDHPAIHYGENAPDNPVSLLQRRLEKGEAALEFSGGGLGYLPGLLRALEVNPDSQALVFSKTSVQAQRISPRNPRAIYFNDQVAIGFVRGGEGLEVAALDARQGILFYTLAAAKSERPRFVRGEGCLHCHQGPATVGVPGIFVGSVYPGITGLPDRSGAIITDHRTAFADRWGGWYVNAMRGQEPDRSNSVAPDPAEPRALASEGNRNLTSLAKFFNPSGYLSGVSDIVALMTFEHQTQAVNLLTRLGWQSRIGANVGANVDAEVESLAAYLLFAGEAPLKEPVQGVSTFTESFQKRGPFDRRGRSLREFDLRTRLFRYPLSYMIYSPAFDALPGPVRERVYRRILEGLEGKDRQVILEILRDTKADLPSIAL